MIRTGSILPLILFLLLPGCDENRKVTEVAREAADRQAQQNTEISRQNQQISGATKELLEADAKARESLVKVQADLQAEQAKVAKQRDALEAERREIATQRYWDPQVAAAITGLGLLLACLLPLVVCILVLRNLHHQSESGADRAMAEAFVEGLLSDKPRLLPGPEGPPRTSVVSVSTASSADDGNRHDSEIAPAGPLLSLPSSPKPTENPLVPHRHDQNRGSRRRRRPRRLPPPGTGPAGRGHDQAL